MNPSVLEPGLAAAGGTGDLARADVREVVQGFAKALRAHLLYEGSGPALERFIESLRARVAALWSSLPHLHVVIEEHTIFWEGEVVFHSEEHGEDLAFILYKDGLRELIFHPGFEGDELGEFVDLLARIQRLRREQEDLLTLLWERDWAHFGYRYVDPLNEEAQLPGGSGVPPRPVGPIAEAEPEAQEPSGTVSLEDFREALYFLDEGELRHLAAELRGEMERDVWTDVLHALFDRLEDSAAARQEQIVVIVADLLPTLLGAGKLEIASLVLREMAGFAAARAPAPEVLRAVRAMFEQLARPETVREMIRVVEEMDATAREEALGQLFAFFPPEALGPLLRAGEMSPVPAVRRAVLSAAERLGRENQAQLVRLIGGEDEALCAGAARLAGRLRIAAATAEIGKLLQRPSGVLRVVAVEALQEIRSPLALGMLERLLDDAEREVRIAAVRGLAAARYSPARAKLAAALDSKRLRETDPTEKIAFFEAFGTVAGSEGVATLERILSGKSWLGRRETADMRACAALGLGKISSEAARAALARAAADPDPVVRNAVGRALRAGPP